MIEISSLNKLCSTVPNNFQCLHVHIYLNSVKEISKVDHITIKRNFSLVSPPLAYPPFLALFYNLFSFFPSGLE